MPVWPVWIVRQLKFSMSLMVLAFLGLWLLGWFGSYASPEFEDDLGFVDLPLAMMLVVLTCLVFGGLVSRATAPYVKGRLSFRPRRSSLFGAVGFHLFSPIAFYFIIPYLAVFFWAQFLLWKFDVVLLWLSLLLFCVQYVMSCLIIAGFSTNPQRALAFAAMMFAFGVGVFVTYGGVVV